MGFLDNAAIVILNSSSLDKIAPISQIISSDAFSWMKNFVFWLSFIEVCF